MSKKVGMRGLVFVQNPRSAGGTRYPWQFFCPGGPPKRNNMQDAALSGSNVVSRQGARDLTPAARFMPRPAAPHP
jgi:hypothetical protein